MIKRILGLILISVLSVFITSPSTTLANYIFNCPAPYNFGTGNIRIDTGLLTTVKDPTTTQTTFCTSGQYILNTTGSNNPAAIPQFSLISYPDMKSIYFDQHKSDTDKQTIANINDINFNKPLYYVAGDLTITNKLNVPANKAAVIFIDGNLIFAPANAGQKIIVSDKQSSAVSFVVNGDIRVGQSVTEIDAFLITYGQFCSSWDNTNNICSTYNNPLTINGSLITLTASKPPTFLRTNGNNDPTTSPGEAINYNPKYLVLLKDVFAKTLQIWSELTTEQ